MKDAWPSGTAEVILIYGSWIDCTNSSCISSQNTIHRTSILYTTVHLDFLHFAGSYHRSEY